MSLGGREQTRLFGPALQNPKVGAIRAVEVAMQGTATGPLAAWLEANVPGMQVVVHVTQVRPTIQWQAGCFNAGSAIPSNWWSLG